MSTGWSECTFQAHPAQRLSTPPKEHIMKKVSLLLAALTVALAGSAFAQGSAGVTSSTDPARAAAVERHAAELRANTQTTAPAADKTRNTSRHHGKKHHARHHGKHHAKHHGHHAKHHGNRHHAAEVTAK
jgi:hypothetical protein